MLPYICMCSMLAHHYPLLISEPCMAMHFDANPFLTQRTSIATIVYPAVSPCTLAASLFGSAAKAAFFLAAALQLAPIFCLVASEWCLPPWLAAILAHTSAARHPSDLTNECTQADVLQVWESRSAFRASSCCGLHNHKGKTATAQ